MRLYGRRYLLRKMEGTVAKRIESRDGVLWDINYIANTCRVKIQGSDELVVAHFPQNFQVTPTWLKPGNAVRIIHKGGVHGHIEVIGHGQCIPSAANGAAIIPPGVVADDAVLTGCNLLATESDSMTVLVRVGTVRIGGIVYAVSSITMDNTAYIMGMGGKLDEIAGAKAISAAPAAGYYRLDAIVVGADLVIDLIQGTTSPSPVLPAVPSGHVLLGWVFIPCGKTSIVQGDINATFAPATLKSVTMTIADDELAWTELSTTITVNIKDQYGNPIARGDAGGWYVTLEILSGNGTVSSAEEGSSSSKIGQHAGTSGTSVQFTYIRGQTTSDKSPMLQAKVAGTIIFVNDNITLLDSEGKQMW